MKAPTSWKTTYAGVVQYAMLVLAVINLDGAVTIGADGRVLMPAGGAPLMAWIFFGLYIAAAILKAKVAADAHPTPPPGTDSPSPDLPRLR